MIKWGQKDIGQDLVLPVISFFSEEKYIRDKINRTFHDMNNVVVYLKTLTISSGVMLSSMSSILARSSSLLLSIIYSVKPVCG
jgi:hypothetical protein